MTCRPMELADLDKGFISTLSVLRKVDATAEKIQAIFQERERQGNLFTYVIEDDGRICATATLIVETKYYGTAAHVEDVAVAAEEQKKGYGKLIMEYVKTQAIAKGCYKNILDCGEKNITFYEKCGYHTHERQMRLDLPK